MADKVEDEVVETEETEETPTEETEETEEKEDDFADLESVEDDDEIVKIDPARYKAFRKKKTSEAENLRRRMKEKDDQIASLSPLAKAREEQLEAEKSELQKLQEKNAELLDKLEKQDLESARQRVVDGLGLTDRQAKRLVGKTYDELLADGQEMLEEFGVKPTPKPKAKPKADEVEGGATPKENLGKIDPKAIAKRINLGGL